MIKWGLQLSVWVTFVSILIYFVNDKILYKIIIISVYNLFHYFYHYNYIIERRHQSYGQNYSGFHQPTPMHGI